MIVDTVFRASSKVKDGRALEDVIITVMEEVGELATEINIHTGHKDREPGKDGIVGECVDVIAAVLDIIYLEEPQMTDEVLQILLGRKCCKWVEGKS